MSDKRSRHHVDMSRHWEMFDSIDVINVGGSDQSSTTSAQPSPALPGMTSPEHDLDECVEDSLKSSIDQRQFTAAQPNGNGGDTNDNDDDDLYNATPKPTRERNTSRLPATAKSQLRTTAILHPDLAETDVGNDHLRPVGPEISSAAKDMRKWKKKATSQNGPGNLSALQALRARRQGANPEFNSSALDSVGRISGKSGNAKSNDTAMDGALALQVSPAVPTQNRNDKPVAKTSGLSSRKHVALEATNSGFATNTEAQSHSLSRKAKARVQATKSDPADPSMRERSLAPNQRADFERVEDQRLTRSDNQLNLNKLLPPELNGVSRPEDSKTTVKKASRQDTYDIPNSPGTTSPQKPGKRTKKNQAKKSGVNTSSVSRLSGTKKNKVPINTSVAQDLNPGLSHEIQPEREISQKIAKNPECRETEGENSPPQVEATAPILRSSRARQGYSNESRIGTSLLKVAMPLENVASVYAEGGGQPGLPDINANALAPMRPYLENFSPNVPGSSSNRIPLSKQDNGNTQENAIQITSDDLSSAGSSLLPTPQRALPISTVLRGRSMSGTPTHVLTPGALRSSPPFTSKGFPEALTSGDHNITQVRKPHIISFGADGPRNQGSLSAKKAVSELQSPKSSECSTVIKQGKTSHHHDQSTTRMRHSPTVSRQIPTTIPPEVKSGNIAEDVSNALSGLLRRPTPTKENPLAALESPRTTECYKADESNRDNLPNGSVVRSSINSDLEGDTLVNVDGWDERNQFENVFGMSEMLQSKLPQADQDSSKTKCLHRAPTVPSMNVNSNILPTRNMKPPKRASSTELPDQPVTQRIKLSQTHRATWKKKTAEKSKTIEESKDPRVRENHSVVQVSSSKTYDEYLFQKSIPRQCRNSQTVDMLGSPIPPDMIVPDGTTALDAYRRQVINNVVHDPGESRYETTRQLRGPRLSGSVIRSMSGVRDHHSEMSSNGSSTATQAAAIKHEDQLRKILHFTNSKVGTARTESRLILSSKRLNNVKDRSEYPVRLLDSSAADERQDRNEPLQNPGFAPLSKKSLPRVSPEREATAPNAVLNSCTPTNFSCYSGSDEDSSPSPSAVDLMLWRSSLQPVYSQYFDKLVHQARTRTESFIQKQKKNAAVRTSKFSQKRSRLIIEQLQSMSVRQRQREASFQKQMEVMKEGFLDWGNMFRQWNDRMAALEKQHGELMDIQKVEMRQFTEMIKGWF